MIMRYGTAQYDSTSPIHSAMLVTFFWFLSVETPFWSMAKCHL